MKKLICLCCLFLSFCGTVMAQQTFDLNVWTEAKQDISSAGKKLRAGESVMRVFLPEASSATGRMVIALPGGGYSHLALEHEGYDWASYFNKQGIAYAVLTYRMPKGDRERPVSDAVQAIRQARKYAVQWHVNPNDIGIMGSSAGGHLASTVATHTGFDVRPDFQILFYPVISMELKKSHKGSVVEFLGKGQDDKTLVQEFSNDRQVRRHITPPAIILLSNDDGAVPPVTNGVAYYSALQRNGIDAALHVYPSGGHGWGFRSGFVSHQQMLDDLTAWLKHLKTPAADAVKVACIGNSITDGAGIFMSDVYGYPAQLQKLLGNGYLVENYGRSGRTLLNKGNHPYMQEYVWKDCQNFNPDVVVIKLGTNDSKPFNWKYKSDFAGDLQAMLDTLKALPSRPKIFLATPIKAYPNRYHIQDSVISGEIIPIIKKVARKNKLSVIDLYTPFTGHTEYLQKGDGVHPNPQGTKVMAEIIKEAILKK